MKFPVLWESLSSVCPLQFVLPSANTVHINRLLTVVRSRMYDGYIYKCFPLASRQPRAFPYDERQVHPPQFLFTPTTTAATINFW